MNKLLKISPFQPSGHLVTSEPSFLAVGSQSVGGACVDSNGVLYLSDSAAHAIFRVDTLGNAVLFAGTPGQSGSSGGFLSDAKFNAPAGLAADRSGNIYVADSGNHQIRLIRGNRVYKLAGSDRGYENASSHISKFNRPSDVCVSQSGKIYVADTGNNCIRQIEGGRVTTLAGNVIPGDVVGIGTSARFRGPHGVAVDAGGRIYVADTGNRKIKTIDAGHGRVYQFCGSGLDGDTLGSATEASFRELRQIWVDRSGNIFVLSRAEDVGVGRIVRIDGNGRTYSLSRIESDDMDIVNGLAISPNGTIYLTISDDVGLESSSLSMSYSSWSTQILTSSQSSSGILVDLEASDEFEVEEPEGHIEVEFTGEPDDTSTVVVNGVTFLVGNIGGKFVWDIGGDFEHTFEVIGETISCSANGLVFDVEWTGFGSLIFNMAFTLSTEDYNYTVTDLKATITSYKGSGGAITLPSVVNGYPVVSIAPAAFQNNTNITSVTIPDSITSISFLAFAACLQLQTVVIGNGVTVINENTFDRCIALTSVSLPNSLTTINTGFRNCASLTSINIPESVNAISCGGIYHSPWDGCSSLQSIIFEGNAPTVTGCVLPMFLSPTVVYRQEGTTGWTNPWYGMTPVLVDVQSESSSISSSMLEREDIMPTMTGEALPAPYVVTASGSSYGNLTAGWRAFDDQVAGQNRWIAPFSPGSNGAWLQIDLGDSNRKAVNGYYLIDNTVINGYSSSPFSWIFKGSDNATDWVELDRRDGVSVKGEGKSFSFSNTYSYRYYSFEFITTEGSNFDQNVISLTQAKLLEYEPQNDYIWTYLNNKVVITSYIGSEKDIQIPNLIEMRQVVSIGDSAFKGKTFIKTVTIPEGLTTIVTNAFRDCTGLESIQLPSSLTSIGQRAFAYCSSLESVNIPSGVSVISKESFYRCSALSNITLNQGLTSILDYAFYKITNLTSIVIPQGVTTLAKAALGSCANLSSITFRGDAAALGDAVFTGANASAKVYYHYMKSGWTETYGGLPTEALDSPNRFYYDIIGDYVSIRSYVGNSSEIYIPNLIEGLPVEAIGSRAFEHSNLSKIVIPDGVKTIGSYAFSDCNNLITMTIPGSVASLGMFTFASSSNLTSVVIEDGLSNLGISTFASCFNLTTIVIPESVTTIGSVCFQSTGLTSINLPSGLITIESSAFRGCSLLTFMSIPAGVNYIGSMTFNDCILLDTIVFHGDAPEIGQIGTFLRCPCTIYYYEERTGWTNPWNGRPTVQINTKSSSSSTSELSTSSDARIDYLPAMTSANTPFPYVINQSAMSVGLAGWYAFDDDGKNPHSPWMAPWGAGNIPQWLSIDLGNGFATAIDGYRLQDPTIVNGNPARPTAWVFQGSNGPFPSPSPTPTPSSRRMKKSKSSDRYIPIFNANSVNIEPDSISKDFSESRVYEDFVWVDLDERSNQDISDPSGVTYEFSNGTAYRYYRFLFTDNNHPTTITVREASIFEFEPARHFTWTKANNQITITSYIGTSPIVDVPGIIEGLPVVAIGNSSFANNQTITDVRLPSGILTIATLAFGNCSNLETINLPETLIEIRDGAFLSCSKLTEVVIPDSVTIIGEALFSGCSSLTNVIIGSHIPTIKKAMFQNCSNLTTIEIPEDVTSIGLFAFNGCSSLTNVTVGREVVSVENYAFYNNSSLTMILFEGNAPEVLGSSTFGGVRCPIHYRDGTIGWVETLGGRPTSCLDCTWSSSSQSIAPDNFYYSLAGNNATITRYSGTDEYVDVPNSIEGHPVVAIGLEAFKNNPYATQIRIQSPVTSIGSGAFSGCSSLKRIILPDGITKISGRAFSNCSALVNIKLPSNITRIPSEAFMGCSSLTNIDIPSGVESIGAYAFSNCSRLPRIAIPKSVTSLEFFAFAYNPMLTGVYFEGDAPSIPPPSGGYTSMVFYQTPCTIYFDPSTEGWATRAGGFDGKPSQPAPHGHVGDSWYWDWQMTTDSSFGNTWTDQTTSWGNILPSTSSWSWGDLMSTSTDGVESTVQCRGSDCPSTGWYLSDGDSGLFESSQSSANSLNTSTTSYYTNSPTWGEPSSESTQVLTCSGSFGNWSPGHSQSWWDAIESSQSTDTSDWNQSTSTPTFGIGTTSNPSKSSTDTSDWNQSTSTPTFGIGTTSNPSKSSTDTSDWNQSTSTPTWGLGTTSNPSLSISPNWSSNYGDTGSIPTPGWSSDFTWIPSSWESFGGLSSDSIGGLSSGLFTDTTVLDDWSSDSFGTTADQSESCDEMSSGGDETSDVSGETSDGPPPSPSPSPSSTSRAGRMNRRKYMPVFLVAE